MDNSSDVENFIKNLDDLSTLPVLVGKILSLVGREDCSIEDLDNLISHDQAMAERVIH